MRIRSKIALLATLVLGFGCLNPNETKIPAGTRRLSVGAVTACALDPHGTVYCWGANTGYLEFGSAAMPTSGTPVAVSVPRLTSISGGWGQHRCGLTAAGMICWGRGASGQLGDGSAGNAGNPPTSVVVQEDWADVTTGRLITCGLNAARDAFCWGLNQRGELGDTLLPANTRQMSPNRVVGDIKFSSVVAGWLHTCGIATSGTLYCWGDNTSGQLGLGTIDSVLHPKPTAVVSSLQFRTVALSARATCAVSIDDQLLCWGYNGAGQLGDGTTTTRSLPTPVALAKKWKDVSMGTGFVEGTTAPAPTGVAQGGTAHACAVDDTSAAYCWGWNGAGQIGDGSKADRLSPTAVLTTVKFDSVALGSSYSCATSGTAIYCWGGNSVGQVGVGAGLVDATQPVRVLTSW